MKKIIFIGLLFTVYNFSFSQVQELSFDELQPRLNTESDTLYLVNFWATWCVPCVKELPEFEKINRLYSDRKVKVLLVSLDNPRHIQSRLLPFIEKYDLKSEVVLLDDPRSSRWIPLVDKTWSGAIPATIVFNNNSRTFFEQVFTYEELENIVKSKLN